MTTGLALETARLDDYLARVFGEPVVECLVSDGPMSRAIWITGVPGCGKSTVARAAASRLAERE